MPKNDRSSPDRWKASALLVLIAGVTACGGQNAESTYDVSDAPCSFSPSTVTWSGMAFTPVSCAGDGIQSRVVGGKTIARIDAQVNPGPDAYPNPNGGAIAGILVDLPISAGNGTSPTSLTVAKPSSEFSSGLDDGLGANEAYVSVNTPSVQTFNYGGTLGAVISTTPATEVNDPNAVATITLGFDQLIAPIGAPALAGQIVFTIGSSTGSGSGSSSGGADCSNSCPSTCDPNVPAYQACLYCQAACLCKCSGDNACYMMNAQSASDLGMDGC